jgi:ribA/ribD-fused uncharacterized protein
MITHFHDKYHFLCNFHPCIVKYEDEVDSRVYPSTEHAYQAAKFLNSEERAKVCAASTCAKAKKLGNRKDVKIRDDWEQVKLQVMETLLRQKFNKPEFKNSLLMTGNEELMEGNTWGDRFWGCTREHDDRNEPYWKGQNWLGKLLMKIREEIRGNEAV